MGKKILVISMKAGYGHIKAGQALEEYARKNLPGLEVTHIDLCEIEPMLGKFFQKFYDIASNHFPRVWGRVYTAFDKEPVASAFHKMSEFQGLFNRKTARYLKDQGPEAIIFTNVVCMPMVAPLCREIFYDKNLSVVVTDYHGHSYYNVPVLDRYFVAIKEVGDDLARAGIGREKIAVTGIPVSPKFYVRQNKDDLKRKLKVESGRPTILLVSRMEKGFIIPAIRGLLARWPKINLVAVTGGNDRLYKKIKDSFAGAGNLKLVNWTNRIDEYMKISDVVVSKPGGLMISECLALAKSLVMTDPIPGQEERNADFMTRHGYGILAVTGEDIVAAVERSLAGENKTEIQKDAPNPCAAILEYFR